MTAARSRKAQRPAVNEPASPTPSSRQVTSPENEPGRLRDEIYSRLPQALTVSVYAAQGLSEAGSPATVRLVGRRVDGHGQHRERFVHDEPVGNLPPGMPFALTARIPRSDGSWRIEAALHAGAPDSLEANRRTRRHQARAATTLSVAAWSWRKWRLSGPAPGSVPSGSVAAGPTPLARVPAIARGAWFAAAAVALVVALGLQWWLIRLADLWEGWSLVSLGAVGVGALGARGWYRFLHRDRPGSSGGWAVQGFVATLVATLGIALGVAAMTGPSRPGAVLDATIPALLIGLGIGRLGCFFTGCCAGRPTTGRVGLLASDRRLLVRRVPVQLYEAAVGVALGVGVLTVTLLARQPLAAGALFFIALGLHVGLRQLILRWRVEPRRTRLGGVLVACAGLVTATAALTIGLQAALP